MIDTSKERCEEQITTSRAFAFQEPQKWTTVGEVLNQNADLITALRKSWETLQTLCNTKTKEMSKQDRLITALQKRVAEVERMLNETTDAVDAALNMVSGDGMPPNWDWLREVRRTARALIAKHGGAK